MPTTFPTFEQWLEENFPRTDRSNAENSAAMREVYDRARLIEENAPTVIPPSPSWCVLARHDYDSVADPFDYTRVHTSSKSAVAAVDQLEHNDGRGTVRLDEPTVYVHVVNSDLDGPGATDLADELRLAADMLDRIKAGEL